MSASARPVLHRLSDEVEGELRGLRLYSLHVSARPGPSNTGLRRQLRALSDRISGRQALLLRRQPIAHAYRVFFRHVGLDPDVHPTPIERAILERLRHGGFASRNRVDDALLIALVETGVPVEAFDEAALQGALTLRPATADDEGVPGGRLALADDARALGELFGPMVPGVGVTARTREIRLFAVAVTGVPDIQVDEALALAEAGLTGR